MVRRVIHRLGRPRVGKVQLGDFGRLASSPSISGSADDVSIERHYVATFLAECTCLLRQKRHGVVICDQRFEDVVRTTLAVQSPCVTTPIDFGRQGAEAQLDDAIQGIGQHGREPVEFVVAIHVLSQVYHLPQRIGEIGRALAPQGLLLASFPGTIHAHPPEQRPYWGLTPFAAKRIVASNLKPESCSVTGYGNVVAAIMMLRGASASELTERELNANDPQYPLVIGVTAVTA